ncbi:hypothetical protein L6270_05460 [Candidatus Parcubacteria bacterium]|nr:hypothetical protein [Patescibacteria group bacterium]MBU4309406.1 hypothetical protein [Patescibacteria group bacterium]MBU4431971.1 hypothetical protein [Patescibacteria group bacterium]MBU4577767.1 hypothetical protein [Patescibacteria group bacterium]MCG2697452.1 hypothetical protein [Candidatus Parcubacteria bacterium]
MTVTQNLNEGGSLTDGDVREMVKKNLQLSEEMHVMMKKMNSFIFWSKVGGFLKFLIIFLPLILSAIYLTPLLKNALGQYQQLLNMGQPVDGAVTGVDLKKIDIKSLPPEIQKLIPKK